MGFFDFLKRKPAPPPEDDDPLPEDEGPSPHYAFAHYALRQMALSDPLKFLAIVVSPDAGRFMDALLQDVADQCDRQASFDATSVKIHQTLVNSFPCAVIVLPEPQEMTEAFMVAVVVPIDMSSEQLPDRDTLKARYFTLEKGFSSSNKPQTVLAEWDMGGHLNYGDGPPANVDAFVAALGKHV